MKRGVAENISLVFGVFLVVVILLLLYGVVQADNGHGHNHGGETTVDTDVTVDTSVDVADGPVNVTNKSKALALSNVLGDVDIAGCLGSTQWATPLFSKQKLVLNWPCLTEFYLRNGQYELAAMAICNTAVNKEFASEQECRDAHDFQAMVEEPMVVSAGEDDEVEYLRDELENQAMQIKSLEQSRRVVIREPYLTDEQKAKLRELKQ